MDMFEKASRLKLRFEAPKGLMSVEDLWDLPLRGRGFTIDDLAKSLNRQIREDQEDSFVVKKSAKNEKYALQFDIVKHVIDVRLDEEKVRLDAEKEKRRKERIKEIIAKKEDEELANASIEDLKKELGE